MDGQDVALKPNQGRVRLMDPVLPYEDIIELDPATLTIGPSAPLATYTDYTVRVIRAPRQPGYVDRDGAQIFDPTHDELKYLAPADWSDFKAISHQFSK